MDVLDLTLDVMRKKREPAFFEEMIQNNTRRQCLNMVKQYGLRLSLQYGVGLTSVFKMLIKRNPILIDIVKNRDNLEHYDLSKVISFYSFEELMAKHNV